MDLVVPRRGLVKGAKFENLIQLFTKIDLIRWISLACVACDLWGGQDKDIQ